ncbi:MAG: TIGR04283 family arsenosugar biosynthesis glycosyltransferase [Burkholderiales bacterium]
MKLSVIVPTLNEASGIQTFLEALAPLRLRGHQVIVADGGSSDATAAIAKPLTDIVLSAPKGRATQMNAGAAQAKNDVLLFLHADTFLPEAADKMITDALINGRKKWGRFDVNLNGGHKLLSLVAASMNLRSRLTGIATGDQAIFLTRELFHQAKGFPAIALMEDIALSKILKRDSAPACLRAKVISSGRRWERQGLWRTVFFMWRLRLAYFFGADPQQLAGKYEG